MDLYKVGWRAVSLSNAWIQVDLHVQYAVTGVILQGNGAGTQWVTEYQIQYKKEDSFMTYADRTHTSVCIQITGRHECVNGMKLLNSVGGMSTKSV